MRSKLVLLAIVLLVGANLALAGTTGDPDAPFVWATDPENGDILLIQDGDVEETFSWYGYSFEDIVYGPDKLLYACGIYEMIDGEDFEDPIGVIVRFDPTLAEPGLEVVHDADDGSPFLPGCGWFTHKGALVVTDTVSTMLPTDKINGVWIFPDEDGDYEGCVADEPCPLVDSSDLPAGFVGGGVTQAANGDLLIVDQGNGQVLSVPYSLEDGFLTDELGVMFDDLDSPIGIARLSTGEIFVTSGTQIQGFELALEEGDEVKDWDSFCFADFSGDYCSSYPQFVEVTANDWLYMATVDACEEGPSIEVGEDEYIVSGSLWAIDSDCNVYEVEDEGEDEIAVEAPPLFTYYDGTLSGVALPPTSRTIELAYDAEGSGDLVFNFEDHIYEVTAENSCDASNTVFETPPACADALIPYDPDFDAEPVIYLGEGGFADVYNLTTSNGNGELVGCQPPGEVFLHAISAYTDLLQNPTIVRCEDEDHEIQDLEDICSWDVDNCEYLELASFFPFDGNLPDDGRIGSRGAASFSLYFLVDFGLSNDGAGEGSWCGFRNPVATVTTPDDPDMSVFREGRTVPLKFKVKEDGGNCRKGPFIAPDGILLSIARVDPDFETQEIVCRGGGCGEVPYFDAPGNPKKGFHMNIRTDGFEPGIYQAVLIATGGEFPLAWTYFEIVP